MYLLLISKILFQIPRLSVHPLPVTRNSVIPPAPKFFSLYNVILCRLPGGARQCPRSGHFLVKTERGISEDIEVTQKIGIDGSGGFFKVCLNISPKRNFQKSPPQKETF